MQQIENDMEDLFRKAAENYSLKTEPKNWDDIAADLTRASELNASDKRGLKKYTWLLLLVFLFLATPVTVKIFYAKNRGPYSESTKTNANKENTTSGENNQQDNSKTSLKNIASDDLIVQPVDTKYKNITRHKTSRQVATFTMSKEEQESTENKEVNKINSSTKFEKLYIEEAAHNDIHEIAPIQKEIAEHIDLDKAAEQKNEKPGKENSKVSDSLKKNTGELQKTKNTKSPINTKGFYLGIIAGPQVNQVKGQGFTKIGISAGILTGYRFTKGFSVETGILYSRKHYFSEGKYFDMSKTGSTMPANMNVISLNGISNIFEIPLEFKFDFATKNNSNWFISTGVSSYILTKESNDYFLLISGVQQNMHSNYANKRGYFLATLNLSIGNEINIGNNLTKIRIEPYLQMPIHGFGIGAMPVYSAGLHVGITLPVKK